MFERSLFSFPSLSVFRDVRCQIAVLLACVIVSPSRGDDPLDVWPHLAPGETTRSLGEAQPPRAGEAPPVTRVAGVSRPTFTVHVPENPNGSAVVILPGGGFRIVVPDKEGTEAADWLVQHGVTCFVLSYRTTAERSAEAWRKPLQDAQRTLALVRSRADQWNLDPQRIGLLAFSAGGQVGTRLLCDGGKLAYEPIDEVDRVSHRPDFALLIYPWNLYDSQTGTLIEGLEVPENAPPTFLVHTDNDRSSSLGTVLVYAGLKKHAIPAELHVYGNGGHGYGLRPVDGSQISTWTDHAAHWLGTLDWQRAAKPR